MHPSVIGFRFDYTPDMAAHQITVEARIRRRTAPDEPLPEERWDRETAGSYEEARDAIKARLPTDEIILAWYVTRGQPLEFRL